MTMTPDDAVDECRRAFAAEAPAWLAPLIRFLDQPPDEGRVFAWVFRCTRLLLDRLEAITPDLEEQLALFAKYLAESVDMGVVQETVDRLWVQRSPHEFIKTAVVRLFTALIGYRAGGQSRHLPCTLSIIMLVRASPDQGQAFEAVRQDFLAFVREDSAQKNPLK